ncbi:MAG: TatD family deoxyribonuclease [Ruminococcaceae bacterium]|nr:TatD family deoxyribonuclease [Oscillospiraceae bacterium]
MIEFLNETPLKNSLIFDTHAHYDDERFEEILEELFPLLHKNGVGGIVTCGCDEQSSIKALQMAENQDFVYAAVGVHPGNIENETDLSFVERLCANKKCVAIGEIGLDYYWTQDNKPEQKRVFAKQLELANKLNLPVLVHDREAHADTLEFLKQYKPKGVVHSFSGSVEMAEELLKIGMYIGVSGVITFKNAKKLPDVVKMLPEDRILLETDAPYLAPVPYRSKTNNSTMIYLSAQKIADIRETTVEHILNVTFKNAQNLFGI